MTLKIRNNITSEIKLKCIFKSSKDVEGFIEVLDDSFTKYQKHIIGKMKVSYFVFDFVDRLHYK